MYGPEMDQIIHEYRSMTGHAPMLPKWAYGYFQSKDRYKSQEEILGIAQAVSRPPYPYGHHRAGLVLVEGSKAIPSSTPISRTCRRTEDSP